MLQQHGTGNTLNKLNHSGSLITLPVMVELDLYEMCIHMATDRVQGGWGLHQIQGLKMHLQIRINPGAWPRTWDEPLDYEHLLTTKLTRPLGKEDGYKMSGTPT